MIFHFFLKKQNFVTTHPAAMWKIQCWQVNFSLLVARWVSYSFSNLKGCIWSLIVSFRKLRKYKVSGHFVFKIFCIFEYFSFHFCILWIHAEERIPRKFIPKKQEMCAPIKYATLKHPPPHLKIHSKHFLWTEFQSYSYFQFVVFRAEWEFGLGQL